MNFKRYVAFIIDWLIIGIPVNIYLRLSDNEYAVLIGFFGWGLVLLIKDLVFRNASIGKLIMNVRVVSEDGTHPSFKQILKRNITYIIPPFAVVEAIVSFATPNHTRLGDMLAKTKVVNKIK